MNEELLTFFMDECSGIDVNRALNDGIRIHRTYYPECIEICDRGVENGYMSRRIDGERNIYSLTEESKTLLWAAREL